VFLAPLGVAFLASPDTYASFEIAMAWASPLALVVALGLPSAVPYFLITRNRPDLKPLFLRAAAVLSFAGLLAGLAFARLPLPGAVLLAALATSALAAQAIHSALLRAGLRPALALAMEGAVGGATLVACGFGRLSSSPLSGPTIAAAWAALLVLFFAPALRRAAGPPPPDRRPWPEVLRFSFPLILAAIAMGFLSSLNRILSGASIPARDVAALGLMFRLLGGAILIHQLLGAKFVARIYSDPPDRADAYAGRVAGAVGAGALVLWAFLRSGPAGPLLERSGFAPFPPRELLLVALQMPLWSAAAHGQAFMERHGLGRHLALLAVLASGAAAGGALLSSRWRPLDLFAVALAQDLALGATVLGQILLLRRAGFPLPRTALATLGFLALMALSFL
jgi:hypothetical protein